MKCCDFSKDLYHERLLLLEKKKQNSIFYPFLVIRKGRILESKYKIEII